MFGDARGARGADVQIAARRPGVGGLALRGAARRHALPHARVDGRAKLVLAQAVCRAHRIALRADIHALHDRKAVLATRARHVVRATALVHARLAGAVRESDLAAVNGSVGRAVAPAIARRSVAATWHRQIRVAPGSGGTIAEHGRVNGLGGTGERGGTDRESHFERAPAGRHGSKYGDDRTRRARARSETTSSGASWS